MGSHVPLTLHSVFPGERGRAVRAVEDKLGEAREERDGRDSLRPDLQAVRYVQRPAGPHS